MAGMALPSVLRLLILSTLTFNWYGATVVGRAVEDLPRRTSLCDDCLRMRYPKKKKKTNGWLWGVKYIS